MHLKSEDNSALHRTTSFRKLYYHIYYYIINIIEFLLQNNIVIVL